MKQPDLDLFEELSEERGFSLIPLQGEVPIEKDWTRYCTEERPFPRTEFEGRNAGVACGPASGVLVLDVDAPEIFSRVCKDKGRDLPPTLTVTTGSGKPHYYFAYPMDGKTYGCRACKSEGYDVRGLGGQVVAPGSCHPQTGKLYTISKDLPLAPAPKWLLDLARKDEPRREPPSQRPTSIWSGNVDVLPISEETKELIRNGAPLGHRSEAVMSVVNALVWANLADSEIFGIFESYSIGDKYREKGNARERWLQAHIDKARAFVAIRAGDSSPPKRTFTTEGDRSHLETPPDFHLTDVGNAELMVWLHGKNIRYCHPWKTWFVWDGMRHLEDETGEIYRIGKDTVRHRYAQAARETEADRRKALAKFATRSESDRSIQAMISSARSEPGIPVRPADLDADPWLFNCPNGTVNLRNGDLLPHNRADNITKLAGAPYIHGSESPLLQSVLNRCMGGNDRLIAFLQRLCGYALTGDTSEQILPIFYWIGQNGKGTLTETLRKVLADYARNADIGTFLAKHNEEARHDLARLKGARLVTATETDADSKLAEALVKRITAEDPVTCRHLYQGAFEYIPSWKLFLAVNHKPQIWGTDWAIWRRILLVPWTVVIPPGEQDRGLKQKLVAELPGVLSWLVQGCLKWQEKGLDPPPEVLEASARYREEMDALADFLASYCVLSPTAEVAAKDLFEAYEEWCKQDAQKAFSKKTFGLKLGERGFSSRRGGGGRRLWRGLRLVNPGETPPEPPRTVTCGDPRNPYVTECVTPLAPDFTAIHAQGDLTVAGSPNFSLASSRVGLSGTHVTTPHTSPERPPNDVSDTSHQNLSRDGGLPDVPAEVTSLTSPEDGPCARCRARADRPGHEGWWCFREALFEGKSGKPTRITEDLGAGCPHRKEE